MGTKLIAILAALGLVLVSWLWFVGTRPARTREALRAETSPAAPIRAAEPAPGLDREPAVDAPAESRRSAPQPATSLPPAASARIAGIVRDDRRTPLAGAEVQLVDRLPGQGERVLVSARSDAAGRFQLALDDGLAREDDRTGWILLARLEGYLPAEVVDAPDSEQVELVLVERPLVSGVLLTPDGSPARPPGRVDLRMLDDAGETHEVSAEIDELGRFESRELVPGRLVGVGGRARGHGKSERALDLVLAPGERATLDLVLVSGATVRGQVVDAESREPVPFAEVWAESWMYDAGSIEPSAVADSAGRFELRGVQGRTLEGDALPEGALWLMVTARAPGYAGRPFEGEFVLPVSEGVYEMEIAISRADASLRARVLWPDGSPASAVPVWGLDSGSNFQFAQSDRDGRFELTGLPPGELALCARTNPEDPRGLQGRGEARVELALGQQARVDIWLAQARESISGRVLGAEGEPLEGVGVEAGEHFQAGNLVLGVGHHRATTDAQGRYELSGLSPGRYQVEVSAPALAERAARPEQATVVLAAGEVHDQVDFRLVPAVHIAGWVDLRGGATDDYDIVLIRTRDDVGRASSTPDEQGRFRFDGLYPEAHVVVLRRAGREVARAAVGPAGAEGLALTASE